MSRKVSKMRSDFSKVVTERPRAGGKRGPKGMKKRAVDRHVWRADDDPAAATKQGMMRPHVEGGDWKAFTDLLGPLQRFLQTRVGKPWNKVHKEICANLKGRSTQQQHILDHLKHMVETKLYWDEDERVLRNANGTKFEPLYLRENDYYVDPRDGILKTITEKMRNKRLATDRARVKAEMDEMKTKDGQVFRRVDGIWYEITTEVKTVVLNETLGTRPHYVQESTEHKRQLGTEELRKRGLAND